MSERAPNILPMEQHKELQNKIAEVADLTKQASETSGRWDPHYAEIDEGRVQFLGQDFDQNFETHRVKNKADGDRVDVKIREKLPIGERRVHSYSDRREPYNSTDTTMEVKRSGKERKVLHSDNPLVHEMVADIALKEIAQKARTEIEKSPTEKAA